MKKKTVKYEDLTELNGEPIGEVGDRIYDLDIPSPAEIADSLKTQKVTLLLSQKSLEYVKKEAKQHGCSYQKMIRYVVDAYASKRSHVRSKVARHKTASHA